MAVENAQDEVLKNTGNYRMRPSIIPPLTADTTDHGAPEPSEDNDEFDNKKDVSPVRHTTETRKLKRAR